MLRAALAKMGQGTCLIIATDNDAGGRALADQIEAIAQETDRADLRLARDLPEGEGRDWNQVLRAASAHTPAGPLPGPA